MRREILPSFKITEFPYLGIETGNISYNNGKGIYGAPYNLKGLPSIFSAVFSYDFFDAHSFFPSLSLNPIKYLMTGRGSIPTARSFLLT